MATLRPSTAVTPGKFNVYSPTQRLQYTAFDTLAEAQAAVRAQQTGVILDPSGKLDPSVQTWSGWNSYQANFPLAQVVLSPGSMPGAAQPGASSGASPIPVTRSSSTPSAQLQAARIPGQVNVWIPQDMLPYLDANDRTACASAGAFLAFDSVKAAEDEVRARGYGVVLDTQGHFVARQPWPEAGSYAGQQD